MEILRSLSLLPSPSEWHFRLCTGLLFQLHQELYYKYIPKSDFFFLKKINVFSFKMPTEISAWWFPVAAYLLFPSQWLPYVSFLKLPVIVDNLDKKAEKGWESCFCLLPAIGFASCEMDAIKPFSISIMRVKWEQSLWKYSVNPVNS